MRQSTIAILKDLEKRYPVLASCRDEIARAAEIIIDTYKNGGKLLACGNGGSASDALHIVGELMKSFVLKRPIREETVRAIHSVCDADADYLCKNLEGALPAIALVSETALITAYSNDAAPDLAFAQQVLGYGRRGDVLIAISTSGNSANVIYAAEVARALGVKVVSLTGQGGGKLSLVSDCTVAVPDRETYRIQELHLPVYHTLCMAIENEFFGA
jgi:D-sedoheptulose 7-phosphate isomerase